jgi:Chemoreceptor zinc-binding domain
MLDKEEIDKAINIHSMWKVRLRQAIDSGKIDVPVETIRQKDQCAFGKWLYGSTFAAGDKASPYYKTVCDLHAEFHTLAAKVAELAVAGKKDEAVKMLTLDGPYGAASAKLTGALMDWKRSFG